LAVQQSGPCLEAFPQAEGRGTKLSSQKSNGQQLHLINPPPAIRLTHLAHIKRSSACSCCAATERRRGRRLAQVSFQSCQRLWGDSASTHCPFSSPIRWVTCSPIIHENSRKPCDKHKSRTVPRRKQALYPALRNVIIIPTNTRRGMKQVKPRVKNKKNARRLDEKYIFDSQ